MITIKERAIEYAKEYDPTYETERAYVVGASTQLHIDMTKACKVLSELLYPAIKIYDGEGSKIIGKPQFLELFRAGMIESKDDDEND